jgi:hypothetical protein
MVLARRGVCRAQLNGKQEACRRILALRNLRCPRNGKRKIAQRFMRAVEPASVRHPRF